MRLEDLSDSARLRIERALALGQSRACLGAPGPSQPESPKQRPRRPPARAPEAALQRQVEEWLTHLGYWPRTPKWLDLGPPPRGWWLHFPQARGNPLVLDLLLLPLDERPHLELELKGCQTRVARHQRQIAAQDPGHASLHRDFEELRRLVMAWDRGECCKRNHVLRGTAAETSAKARVE